MAEEAFPPRLLLIGAQKAGTTTLAFLLDQHPDIALSDPKEPGFYNARFEKGMGWYRSCFPAQLPAVLLDASTGYTLAPVNGECEDTVVRRIKAATPDARFIYIMRDPVDRTISSYWHDRRSGRVTDALRQVVETSPFYLDVSRYHRQIVPYLNHFPRDRFLFINFAELSSDPLGVAERCIAFAGLDPARGQLQFDRPRNQSFEFNGLGRIFFNLFPNEEAVRKFMSGVRRLTPEFVSRLAKAFLTKPTEQAEDADRAWLAERFREENKDMEAICGFRFYR